MANSKHIHFVLNVDDDGRQFYIAGSTITGTVVLKLFEDMSPILTIAVVFSGCANIRFSIVCDGDARYFNNSKSIFTARQIVWDSCDHQQGLSAGVYKFPFAFQLPNIGLPSSCQIDQDNFVQYSLLAGISQLKKSIFDHQTAERIIGIHEIVNIHTKTTPLTVMQRKEMSSLFQPFGSVSLSVILQRKGYCLGESIAIDATTKNQSKKRITVLRASLTQTLTTYGTANYSVSSNIFTVPGSKCQITVFNQNDYQATSVDGKLS